MKKLLFFSIFILINLSLFGINVYDVIKNDESVITGYILEDVPSSFVIMITLDGEEIRISYKDIALIRPHQNALEQVETVEDESLAIEPVLEDSLSEEGEIIEPLTVDDELIDLDNIESNLVSELAESSIIKEIGYTNIALLDMMKGLSINEIYRLNLESSLLSDTSITIREDVYNELKKGDTLTYTMLNIVPGLGSFLQGDNASAIYTVSSIAAALVYNLGNGFGTDYYFIFNINAIISYMTSFFSPAMYNDKYNTLIEEKLVIE